MSQLFQLFCEFFLRFFLAAPQSIKNTYITVTNLKIKVFSCASKRLVQKSYILNLRAKSLGQPTIDKFLRNYKQTHEESQLKI